MRDINRSITIEDIIRRYGLANIKKNTKNIKKIDEQLTNTDGILRDFVVQTTSDIEHIQDQLDGNITSWFYSGEPTLSNEPAVNWTTTALKDEHLGDIYYDNDDGSAYRFIFENNTYSWKLLQDDLAAKALAVANAAQDTADSKRRIFVVQPIPPYDVGDVWWNTATNELYRCKTAESSEGTFKSTDWINSLKYTDDTTAIELADDLRELITEGYVTKTDFQQTNNSIEASVKALRVITDANNDIYMEQPIPPYKVGDVYINNQEVYRCITEKQTGSYSQNDWALDMELTSYVAEAGISIFQDAINTEVKKKVGNDEIISKINQTPEQITIQADKVNLNGYVTATNLETKGETVINGDNITTGTIDAEKVNVKNINADEIKSGTISGNLISGGTITGSELNGGTINGGTVNLYSTGENARLNITDSNNSNCNLSFSARKLRWYGNGGGLFQIWQLASTPVIGISGGGNDTSINSGVVSSPSMWTDSLTSRANNGGLTLHAQSNYGNYAGNNGVYIEGSGNVTLHAGGYCYARRNNGTASRIRTVNGDYSSKILKKNIKDFKDYDDAIGLLRDMKLYTYDYKYKVNDNKTNFGFIIDELEKDDRTNKFFNFEEETAIANKDGTLDTEKAKEDPKNKDIINFKSFDEATLIKYLLVVCKEQQKQIDKLLERADKND